MERQMMFHAKLKMLSMSYLQFIVMGWILTILALYSLDEFKKYRFERLPFEHFMIYYAIYPAQKIVEHGAEVRHVSDNERFRGGYRVDWDEVILCDHNPHDGIDRYEYYAEVEHSGFSYNTAKARKTPDELIGGLGFPAKSRSTGKIIRYPNHDADCRMVSHMTMTFPSGEKKTSAKTGEVAQVRGY